MRGGWLAIIAMGWMCSAYALGLGEIEVKSRLNEPLSATIPVSATARELEGLAVDLASNEDFERAGLERAEFLSSLKFEIRDRVIVVTSKQAAREPFIGFLLDVRWSGGRLLREYTVLLDPPTVARPTPAPAPKPVPMPKPAPVEAKPAEPKAPLAKATEPEAEPEPVWVEPEASETAAEPESPPVVAGTSGTYGPVQPQETLWSIAYRLRPDPQAITMDQMQLAIYKANPKAFDGGRITGLMAGAVLRIPDTAEILDVDVQDARMRMAAARSGRTPAKPAVRPAPATRPAPAAVVAAPAPAPTPAEPEKPEAVTTPPPTELAAGEPVEEAPVEAADDEAAEVTEPAPDTVVAKVDEPAPAPEPKPEPKPKPAVVTPPPVSEFEPPSLLDELIERAGGLVSEPLFLPAAAGFVVLIVLILGLRKLSNLMAERAYKRASSQKRKPKPGPEAPAVEPEAGAGGSPTQQALEELAGGEDTQAVPKAAAAAMAAAGATRGGMEDTLVQTQAQTMAQTQAIEPTAAHTAGGSKVDFDVTGQFASETVQINLDAGDPLSEAEFHRAYGLYDEAALLLKQALQKDPNRHEARVKLAEIYFEAGKAPEFLEVAKELKQKLPANQWQQIALMGAQIAPSDSLFKDAGASLSGGVDLSFDEPATPPGAPAPKAPAAAPAADEGVLDFKLEDIQLPAAEPEAPGAPTDAGGALEFDLGELGAELPAVPAADAGASKGEGLEFTDFDLNLEAAPETPTESAPAAGDEIALDLGAETPAEPPTQTPELDLTSAAPAEAGESFDLGGDLGGEFTLEESPETGGDESSTKLDLARAYMDMGDNDMARSLLGEVIEQGSDSQKKEAQELLQRVPA